MKIVQVAESKIEIHNHFLPAEGDINEVLLKTLAEAHANTNIKLEIVHEMFRKPQVRRRRRSIISSKHRTDMDVFQDTTQLLCYRNMSKEELWLDCADKLTAMIQNIIEFAKLIPGFMRLTQDDQARLERITLTKDEVLIGLFLFHSIRFFY